MIWRRLLAVIPMILIVSALVFVLSAFLPGDEALTLAGPNASPERVEEIRQSLQLDDPMVVRYARWLGDAVQGDLGTSLFTKRAVAGEIGARWFVTFQLVAGSLLVSLVVGIPAGVLAGRFKGRWPDRLTTVFASFGVAVPSFVVGLWLIILFAIVLGWLPFGGYVSPTDNFTGWLTRMILPVMALSGVMIAELSRQVRAGLVDTMEMDFVRTLRAKGMRERTVVNKHAMRIAISPAIAVISVHAARAFGGAVVVEQIFNLPGLGQLTVQAILQRDLPVLQGVIPVAVLMAVVMTLAADLIHLALNPRLRVGAP